MGKNFNIIKFNFYKELAYPYELIGFLLRKIIAFGFIILFWQILSSGNSKTFDFNQILSYFLISQAVTDLTFTNDVRFGREIQKLIKSGQISNYFIKPMNSIKLLFLSFIGERTSIFIYSLVTLSIGIYLIRSLSFENIFLFLVSIVFATITGIALNLIIGTIGFYSPEASSIQNMFNHMNRIFSGILIPLDYFPGILKTIVSYSFFPILAYYPTTILQRGNQNNQVQEIFLISIFWTIFLLIIAFAWWKKSVREYEGVGI